MEQKETIEERKKEPKKGILVTVLMVLLLAAFAGLGYAIGATKMAEPPKNNEKNQQEEVVEKEISLEDERFFNIYNQIYPYISIRSIVNGYKDFRTYELGVIGLKGVNPSDIIETSETTQWGDHYYTINADIFLNNLKDCFGSEVKVDLNAFAEEHVSVQKTGVVANSSGMIVDFYDENSNLFKVRFSGIGGMSGPDAQKITRKIVKANIKGDTITVEEKIIYVDGGGISTPDPIVIKIYGDPDRSRLLDTKEYTKDTIASQVITVDDYIDQATTITHIYKLDKETGKFYFASSTLN